VVPARRFRPRSGRAPDLCLAGLLLLTTVACGEDPISATMPGWPIDTLSGAAEVTEIYEVEGVSVQAAYPEFDDAPRFSEHLDDVVHTMAEDFALAEPDAHAIGIDWEFAAATEDIVGVRLTAYEEVRGVVDRRTYRTVWYDVPAGRTAAPTELLSDYGALVELSRIAAGDLHTDRTTGVDTLPEQIRPIAAVFNAIGFSVVGDLVVEFDDGLAAEPEAGRAYAVVPGEQADVLLSDLGRRARQAATARPDDVVLPGEPDEDEPAPPDAVPGAFPARDDAVDCSTAAVDCLAVTFDDGPGDRAPELLDALADHDAKATFYVTGELAHLRPDAVRRMYAEGHELGNHTWSHADLAELSASEIEEELGSVQSLLRRQIGHAPDTLRPPYGCRDDAVLEVAAEVGMAQVLRTVDVRDWDEDDPTEITRRAGEVAEPDAIMVLHDIHDATIDAVPGILQTLDEQGYTLVTVSQLLDGTQPGRSYGMAYEDMEDLW
jgi:peptidoglycan-N-acetylglucosamine deacetylase